MNPSPTTAPRRAIDAGAAEPVLSTVLEVARAYLAELDRLPAKEPGAVEASRFEHALPEHGVGAQAAVAELAQFVRAAAVHVDGPRFFHLVAGGTTPAALGGDWLCSLFDQHAFASMSSPAAVRLEQAMIGWLKDLFDLPAEFGGAMVSGGTMANFTALAAARQWCARQQGVDVARDGLGGAPPIPIFTSGLVHVSIYKAAAMLGMGRAAVRVFGRPSTGHVDLDAMESALAQLGRPGIIVASAGEVNAGEFDPIEPLADLAQRHGAWLHVDGTFGLFARISPELSHLARGAERADSVTADGHKWLNVPFDCGFCFLRDDRLLHEVFAQESAYLHDDPDAQGILGHRGPEMSRRARALPVYATLAAYGRAGYRALVEQGVSVAAELAEQVRHAEDFELIVEPSLCITSFRYHPPGYPEQQLDELNSRLGEAILRDGRIYMGTTVCRGRVAFKPAFVNWRTTSAEIDLILPVVRELGEALRRTERKPPSVTI